jgi:hypothetical protein
MCGVFTKTQGNRQKITAFSLLLINQKEASILVPHTGRNPQRTEWVKTLSGLGLPDLCCYFRVCDKQWNRILSPQHLFLSFQE